LPKDRNRRKWRLPLPTLQLVGIARSAVLTVGRGRLPMNRPEIHRTLIALTNGWPRKTPIAACWAICLS
jgi:hypothetical protein